MAFRRSAVRSRSAPPIEVEHSEKPAASRFGRPLENGLRSSNSGIGSQIVGRPNSGFLSASHYLKLLKWGKLDADKT